MGPDCGTAVVGGVGLGFANTVTPGKVGIVAASGTGCQQVLALLDAAGVGVAAALGVGGRDLSAAIGGISTTTALERLDADPTVEHIVVVSKPPAAEVAASVERYADGLATPVRFALLGEGQPDLTTQVEALLGDLGVDVPEWPTWGTAAEPADGGALRGLFVGGTLCDEAMLLAAAEPGRDPQQHPALRRSRPRQQPAEPGAPDDRLRRRRPHPWPGAPDDRPDPAPGAPGEGRGGPRDRGGPARRGPGPRRGGRPRRRPGTGDRGGAGRARRTGRRGVRRHVRRPAGPDPSGRGAGGCRRRGPPVQRRRHPPCGRPRHRSLPDEPQPVPRRRRHRRCRHVRRRRRRAGRPGRAGRLAAADGRHRRGPRHRRRRPAAPRRQRPRGLPDARRAGHARRRRAGLGVCSAWRRASSCTPDRPSSGRARPARCAAR
ncbi:hypothetical protein [Nocardioides convexus]|uniref:hypothetical protein n=1 Tax=Nocardioides convexus TaxID=2712224 RepID=UPI0024184638|nr:hypothetical protein [Nocardioides convexus]